MEFLVAANPGQPAKPLRKVNEGEVIVFSDRLSATVAEKGETDLRLTFNLTGDDFDAALAQAGAMPSANKAQAA